MGKTNFVMQDVFLTLKKSMWLSGKVGLNGNMFHIFADLIPAVSI